MRGQALVLAALLLPLALVPAAALGVEVAVVASHQARLSEVVALAAVDAAQSLDVAAFRAGSVWRLDAPAAHAVVAAELAASDPQAVLDSVSVSGSRLTVTAHEPVPLRLASFVPRPSVTVRAAVTAQLTPGYAAGAG